MKYANATRQIREKSAKMHEHANTATLASRTYTATMELYNVAAAAGDEKAMQMHRDAIHTCVDTILDSGAMVALLQREIEQIAHSVTDFPGI